MWRRMKEYIGRGKWRGVKEAIGQGSGCEEEWKKILAWEEKVVKSGGT